MRSESGECWPLARAPDSSSALSAVPSLALHRLITSLSSPFAEGSGEKDRDSKSPQPDLSPRNGSGEVTPANYNTAWWELRRRYQGIDAPVKRSERDFDPGAKYHVPANVSYTRYFLATILQFQFHRALCEEAGYEGPLHLCSIYDNDAAGKKLKAMLELGLSKPWPDALEAMTGTRRLDATAIIDYFAPLKAWLDEQNAGRPVGY